MATVTLADGSRVDVTPENWNELAGRQIALKGDGYSFQEKSATLDAFKQLAGMGNGFYTVKPGGGAAPRAMGEAAVLNQPLVRLSDRISGNPVNGGSLWRDISDSAVELAGNAKEQAADVAAAIRPPGGWVVWASVAAVVAGVVVVYVASR